MENSNRTIIDSVETLEAALARVKAAGRVRKVHSGSKSIRYSFAAATAANKAKYLSQRWLSRRRAWAWSRTRLSRANYAAGYIYNASPYPHRRYRG